MTMWFTKQSVGMRGWFVVRAASGLLKTGLAPGVFTVTAVAPGDATNAVYAVAESSQKGGLYYFDVPSAFLIAQGVGVYGIVVEINGSGIKSTISAPMIVSVRTFDDLAQPGSSMTLTSGERTAIVSAVWAKVADGNILGLTAEETIDLTRKILNNRLELKDGTTDNWELYDDDDSILLTYDVTDKDGAAIVLVSGAPARRTRGVTP